MAVKIRLTRRGRKKLALYDVVATDVRSPRDGRFIEKLGTYNPNVHPPAVELNDDRALYWLMVGALPTDTARTILSLRGIMLRKHLQIGVNKGAITQEQADKRFEEWKKDKEARTKETLDSLMKKSQEESKARKAAEQKVKEARTEAILKKAKVEEQALLESVREEADDAEDIAEAVEDQATQDQPTDETPAETVTEEAPVAKEEPAPTEEVKTEEAPEAKQEEETATEEVKSEDVVAEEKGEAPEKEDEKPTEEVKEAPKAEAAEEKSDAPESADEKAEEGEAPKEEK